MATFQEERGTRPHTWVTKVLHRYLQNGMKFFEMRAKAISPPMRLYPLLMPTENLITASNSACNLFRTQVLEINNKNLWNQKMKTKKGRKGMTYFFYSIDCTKEEVTQS